MGDREIFIASNIFSFDNFPIVMLTSNLGKSVLQGQEISHKEFLFPMNQVRRKVNLGFFLWISSPRTCYPLPTNLWVSHTLPNFELKFSPSLRLRNLWVWGLLHFQNIDLWYRHISWLLQKIQSVFQQKREQGSSDNKARALHTLALWSLCHNIKFIFISQV